MCALVCCFSDVVVGARAFASADVVVNVLHGNFGSNCGPKCCAVICPLGCEGLENSVPARRPSLLESH